MPSQGYVRFPTIYRDRIVFVSEDDLWLIADEGGRAERLTAGTGRVSYPHFSPDGELLAFVDSTEGPGEIYVMPASGGPTQRLTFQGNSSCHLLGWSPDGKTILYASRAGQFAHDYKVIYAISPQGGSPQQLPLGIANAISYGPHGGVVLGRNIEEPAYWKRYRGGTAGHLWCDRDGSGTFQRLLQLQGNLADPCWVGERIYFLSDHEGVGNIYSCTPQGEDLRRHTNQHDFYARHLSSDGQRLVFQVAADLYLFDPHIDEVQRLDVTLPGQRTQLCRKFIPAASYLDSIALHPQGHAISLTTRGKAFSMGNWDGAVVQHGEPDGVRYRFLEWLNDGRRLVAVCDAPSRETLVIFDPDSANDPSLLTEVEFGRAVEIAISPTDDIVAIANHRQELILVDLESGEAGVLDRSSHDRIQDLAWAPDGRWIAYSFACNAQQKAIKLGDLESGETHIVTEPALEDVCPSFDPDGKYLYFLGYRIFNPVRDNLQFEWSFPRGVKPYAITLRNDLRSPFIVESKLLMERSESVTKKRETIAEDLETEEPSSEDVVNDELAEKEDDAKKSRSLVIDLEGITSRAIPFPLTEGRYSAIQGIRGKVLLLQFPITGSLSHSSSGWLDCYDLETLRNERLIDNVSKIFLSRDYKVLLYRSYHRLRAIKAGEKPPRSDSSDHPRDSGWIDLQRVKVSVQPASEWQQMFAEAWRLQREQFWTADMSGVDWDAIYAQYVPLLKRVSSRTELSDLIQELQGELGTSHAYEYGGDMRQGRFYRQGFLGVDWRYDAETERYRIASIVRGDPSDKNASSPLTSPGLNIAVGDAVIAINGQRVGPRRNPQELLVNQADCEVQLMIEAEKTKEIRVVTVTAISLTIENDARYHDWVKHNRRTVHTQSQERVGYIHIPNMGPKGFAAFHRSYLTEFDYPALIVDVRWNGGGKVSGLLLEKLARKRIGYKFSRWSQPIPYPREAPHGPMVALTNEHAGSDGDIFCHSFKLMHLGPLIGKRTWGGVVGISPRHRLVDGSCTTQPEYANWFKNVGWDIENYGTEPDIEVDIAPQDYANQCDPQLERAIAEALRLAKESTTLEPKPGERPHRGRFLTMQKIENITTIVITEAQEISTTASQMENI
jgi:tricorn protease